MTKYDCEMKTKTQRKAREKETERKDSRVAGETREYQQRRQYTRDSILAEIGKPRREERKWHKKGKEKQEEIHLKK